MTRTLTRLAAAAAIALLTLTACSPHEGDPMPSDISPSSGPAPEELSAADGRFLDETFPDIARSMGADTVRRLRERTCAGDTASGPTAAGYTSWVADAQVAVTDQAVARQVAQNIKTQAEQQGWTTAADPEELDADGNFSGTRLLGGKHEERDLVMTVLLDEDHDAALTVTTVIRGVCRHMPDGHKMVHSTLDPEYGGNVGGGYVETDDIEDYTGRAKPLPASTQTPPPTGPAGATPVSTIGQ